MLEEHSIVMTNQIEVLRRALRSCAEYIESTPAVTDNGWMVAYVARKVLSGEYGL